MSAINEAYARIDYETIIQLKQDMRELKEDFNKLIGRNAITRFEGQSLSVAKTRIFAEKVSVPRANDEFTMNFGSNRFESAPVVTATLALVDDKQEPNDVSVVIKELTATKVVFEVQRKVKQNVRLHVIAIGEAKSSK